MTDFANLTFTTRAHVAQRANDTSLLDVLKRTPAIDPAIFEETPPFFWQAQISSSEVDAYFTSMQPSTLANFARDAANGVSFQNSHNTRELGIGRSLTGTHDTKAGIVLADFYTVPGLNPGKMSTDEFIRGVRAGVWRDVSVGFYGGRIVNNIDGADLWDWDSPYIPGLVYMVKDAKGVNREVLCLGLVEDARLAEVSIVYDGATPGAAILKAEQQSEAGRIRPEQKRLLEERYRIQLPDKRVQGRGVDIPKKDKESMQTAEEALTEIRGIVTEHGGQEGVEIPHAVRTVLTQQRDRMKSQDTELVRLNARIAELAPQADEGKAYRADLLKDALAEGVRAHGEGFAKETYTELLNGAKLDVVKRMRDDWKQLGDKQFSGGRKLNGASEEEKDKQPATLPHDDAAYRA